MARKVRYTIDLTEQLNEEVEKIAQAAGIPKSEVFRRAIALLKVAQNATRQGERIGIGRDPESLKTEFILS